MVSGNAFAVVAYPILALVVLIRLLRSGSHRARVLCIGIFSVYAIEALKEILFPIPVDGIIAQDFAAVDFWVFANFVPLKDLFGEVADRGQILQNVLVGIPFGFGAWFVFRRASATRVAIAGFAASLSVEIAQLAIGGLIGFMYRVVDVNDLILNTLGVLVGIAMFAVFGLFFAVFDRRIGSPGGRYWSYIRDTVETLAPVGSGVRMNPCKQATTGGVEPAKR